MATFKLAKNSRDERNTENISKEKLPVLAVAENEWERLSLWRGWLQGLPRIIMLYLTRMVTAAQAGKSSAISSAHFGNQFLSVPLSPAKVCSLGEQPCWGWWIVQQINQLLPGKAERLECVFYEKNFTTSDWGVLLLDISSSALDCSSCLQWNGVLVPRAKPTCIYVFSPTLLTWVVNIWKLMCQPI